MNVDRDSCSRSPGMAVERSANHVPIGLIVTVSVGGGMESNEAVAFSRQPFLEEVVAINFGDPTGASSADIFVSAQSALVVLMGVSYRFPTTLASAAPLVTK